MLVELRNYVLQRGRVSLRDLVWHFQVEPDALRAMLDHWIRKGRISREASCPPCGSGCCNCASDVTEFYRANRDVPLRNPEEVPFSAGPSAAPVPALASAPAGSERDARAGSNPP